MALALALALDTTCTKDRLTGIIGVTGYFFDFSIASVFLLGSTPLDLRNLVGTRLRCCARLSL